MTTEEQQSAQGGQGQAPKGDELVITVVDDPQSSTDQSTQQQSAQSHEDEVTDVGKRAKKRIDKLVYEREEATRRAEAAEAQNAELLQYATLARTDNQRLKAILDKGEAALIAGIKEKAGAKMEAAKQKLLEAKKEGDPEKELAAQEELGMAQIEMREATNQEADLTNRQEAQQQQPPQQQQQPPRQQQQAPTPPKPTEKTMDWVKRNPWFEDGEHPDMAATAFGIDQRLKREGVEVESEEYFETLDSEMRRMYPQYQWEDSSPPNTEGDDDGGTGEPPAGTPPVPPVAPAGRTPVPPSNPRTVQLTASQVETAKKLGVTPEQYAKELVKLQQAEAAQQGGARQ